MNYIYIFICMFLTTSSFASSIELSPLIPNSDQVTKKSAYFLYTQAYTRYKNSNLQLDYLTKKKDSYLSNLKKLQLKENLLSPLSSSDKDYKKQLSKQLLEIESSILSNEKIKETSQNKIAYLKQEFPYLIFDVLIITDSYSIEPLNSPNTWTIKTPYLDDRKPIFNPSLDIGTTLN